MFGNIEITKNKSYCNKTSIFKKDVDIEEVLLSSNISYDKKTINTLMFTSIMIIKLKVH